MADQSLQQMPSEIENRRACKRYKVKGVTTRVRHTGSFLWAAKHRTKVCSVINIGIGGFKFISDIPFKSGQSINVEFISGDGIYLPANGEIRYQKQNKNGFLYGVQFKDINVKLIRKIREMCVGAIPMPN